MSDFHITNSIVCGNSSTTCNSQFCGSIKCHRAQQFNQILQALTAASNELNYEEQITATVATICTGPVYVENLSVY